MHQIQKNIDSASEITLLKIRIAQRLETKNTENYIESNARFNANLGIRGTSRNNANIANFTKIDTVNGAKTTPFALKQIGQFGFLEIVNR
jgi:hypothetical protein